MFFYKESNLSMLLGNAGLQVNLKKCQFAMHSLKYLGHVVSVEGIKTDPDKVSAIQKILPRFIRDFAAVAGPLEQLKKKSQTWVWGDSQQKSFEMLKEALTKAPVLKYPDFNKPFIVETDGSGGAIAATLWQESSDKIRQPVAFASRRLNDAEKNYPYIWGRHFKLITDATAIKNLKEVQGKSKLARWALALQEYDFEVEHRPGKCNPVNDALTRLPMQEGTVELDTATLQASHHKPLGRVQLIEISRKKYIISPIQLDMQQLQMDYNSC